MNLSFHLPLVGAVTVHFDALHSPEERDTVHAPEHTGMAAPVRPAETGGLKAPQDRPPKALRRSAPVPADPRDLVFAEMVSATVDAHLDDASFSVSDLARDLGVSRSGLYRRLGAALEQTPQRLIRERRLRRAAQLLDARAGRIGEVAHAVGYRSTAQFSRAFRDHYGMPPSSYAAHSCAREVAGA